MQLINGLFTLPFGIQSLSKAYQKTHYTLPFLVTDHPEHSINEKIKEDLQPFLEKVKIRNDLVFFENSLPRNFSAGAYGTNGFTKGIAAIQLAKNFYTIDQNVCNWVLKHELGHIKHNDEFTQFFVKGISEIATAVFGMYYCSFLSAIALTYIVGITSKTLFSRWMESRADDFAIKHSSNEELLGGRRFLLFHQKKHVDMRTSFRKRIQISSSGNLRSDIDHPSVISRIQKIEKELATRNIEINKDEEFKSVEDLENKFFMEQLGAFMRAKPLKPSYSPK
jgi:hypothetical protein